MSDVKSILSWYREYVRNFTARGSLRKVQWKEVSKDTVRYVNEYSGGYYPAYVKFGGDIVRELLDVVQTILKYTSEIAIEKVRFVSEYEYVNREIAILNDRIRAIETKLRPTATEKKRLEGYKSKLEELKEPTDILDNIDALEQKKYDASWLTYMTSESDGYNYINYEYVDTDRKVIQLKSKYMIINRRVSTKDGQSSPIFYKSGIKLDSPNGKNTIYVALYDEKGVRNIETSRYFIGQEDLYNKIFPMTGPQPMTCALGQIINRIDLYPLSVKNIGMDSFADIVLGSYMLVRESLDTSDSAALYIEFYLIEAKYRFLDPDTALNMPLNKFLYAIDGLEDNNTEHCVYSVIEALGFGEQFKVDYPEYEYGVTPLQIYDFALRNKINIRITDMAGEIIIENIYDKKKRIHYGVAHMGHLYLVTESYAKAAIAKASNSWKNTPETTMKLNIMFTEHKETIELDDLMQLDIKDIGEQTVRCDYRDRVDIVKKFLADKKIPTISRAFNHISFGDTSIHMLEPTDAYDCIKSLEAISDYESYLNKETLRIFDSVPTAIIVEFCQPTADEKIHSIDVNKQYTYCLGSNAQPYFSATNKPEPYEGDPTKLGFYYWSNQTMFIRNTKKITVCGVEVAPGWYNREFIQLLLDGKYIKESWITHQLIANRSLDFSSYIDQAYKNFANPKYVVNRTIGTFRKTHTKRRGAPIIVPYDDHNAYLQYPEVTQIDDEFCMMQATHDQLLERTAAPIYCNVIQLANVQMLQTMLDMQAEGCKILSAKTDCIYYHGKVMPSSTEIGGWKYAEVTEYKPIMKQYRMAAGLYQGVGAPCGWSPPSGVQIDNLFETYDEDEKLKTIDYEYPDDKDFSHIEKFIEEFNILGHKCVSIEGMAGSGKSHVMKGITQYLIARGERPTCLAFQNNISSQMIGGKTIHKKLHMSYTDHRLKSKANIKGWIILDEYQQVPVYLMDLIYSQVVAGKARLICFGDERQFCAIEDNDVCHVNKIPFDLRIYLTGNKRIKNTEYIDLINAKKWNAAAEYCTAESVEYVICYYNADVKKYNDANPSNKLVCITSKGYIKKGSHYIKISDTQVKLDKNFHGAETVFDVDKWDIFTPGYAFTCHKIQGLTVTANYGISVHYPRAVTDRYLLVALTRCTDPSQIMLVD